MTSRIDFEICSSVIKALQELEPGVQRVASMLTLNKQTFLALQKNSMGELMHTEGWVSCVVSACRNVH